MRAPKEKNTWHDKTNIITVIFLSVSLSFTVFFFSTMDLFLSNQKEFYIGAVHIIVPMLLLAVLGSFVLTAAGLLSLKNKTAYNVLTSLLFGLLLAVYIQVMFYNGRMDITRNAGKISNASYDEINAYNLCNSYVMYMLLMMPLIMTVAREKYNGKNTLMNFAKGKVIPYLSAVIFAMQLFGFIGSLAENGILTPDNSEINCFSFEPLYSFSKEENITVFILDTLDSRYMDDALKEYPEMEDKLEGFTYYRNNVPRYTGTFPSVPYMLTNKEFSFDENRIGYLERIWQDDTMLDILSKNDYCINVLLDGTSTFRAFDDISGYNTVIPVASDNFKVNYTGRNGIIYTMVNLSLSKQVPYLLKNHFIFNVNFSPSEEFLILNDDIKNNVTFTVSIPTDIKLGKYFISHEANADCGQKQFSFIHMTGSHDVDSGLSALYPQFDTDTDTPTLSTTVRGQFETLFRYFDEMKELDVYDNSTIIIIADHGEPLSHTAAALLIKPKGSDHAPLRFDEETELSNVNLFPSILEYAGIDHSGYSPSFNDIIEGDRHQTRYVTFAAANKVYDISFEVTGDARQESSWKEIS